MDTVLHICLTAPYQDNMGYDENIMPKFHVKQGYRVYLLSAFCDNDDRKMYVNDAGVIVVRIKERGGYLARFGAFEHLAHVIKRINPQIIYVHNAQFIGFIDIIKYV